MTKISDLRREYSKAELDITKVSPDPIQQFKQWLEEALQSDVIEPNAMSLATLSHDNRPSCRIVLLKGVEENSFLFYSNFQSRKGQELEINPVCALTFFWPELERQIRIEGSVARVDEQKAEAYFQSRPLGSQIGAWSSPQSAAIDSRAILEERAAQIAKRFEGQSVLPKPKQWGGYKVDPTMIEFWQGRANRLHDRLAYRKENGVWKIQRLAP